MRGNLLIFFLICYVTSFSAQCTYEDDLVIFSQEQLDEFVANSGSCNRLVANIELTTGLSVAITGLDIGTPIYDISGLLNIESIVGSLKLNIQIADFEGISNLKEITGTLEIVNSDNIIVLDDFNKLTNVGGNIKITQNNFLEKINGFSNLLTTGGIEIAANERLQEVNAFNNLKTVVNTLEIGSEPNILEIDGFNELELIGNDLLIRLNPNLLKVASFNKLKNVGNNLRIETAKEISGFDEFVAAENQFEIFGEGIESIPSFNKMQYSGGRFSIENTNIESIVGFDNLESVGEINFEDDWFRVNNNKRLNNVQGFWKFEKVEGFLEVKDNSSLSDCSWLCNILNNGEITGDLIIQNNLGDCLNSIKVILICDIDFDDDGVPNVNDLDDDNDGILDTQEGNATVDTDKDGYPDSLDLDSDNDLCFDTVESGFDDGDNDGILGSAPNPVTFNGLISDETTGYMLPLDKDTNGTLDFQEASVLNPGKNNEIGVCLNEGKVNLFNALNGSPDEGGIWIPELKGGNGIFDPSLDAEGIYTYMHSDAICGDVSAQVKVEIVSKLKPGLDTEVVLCDLETKFDLFSKIDGNPSPNGSWLPVLASGTNIFDPVVDKEREYKYVIRDRNCGTLQSSITFKSLEVPNSGESSSLSICEFEDNINLFEELEGSPDDNGVWSPALPGGIFNPQLNTSGRYTYTVDNGECGLASSFVDVEIIRNSVLENVSIKVKDFSSTNNQIEVNVFSNRKYEYSIDGITYQENNIFNNVAGGLQTVYIRGIDGCQFYTEEVFVRTYLTFFTPNGDGNNDFWRLKDFPDINYTIYIYTRFGRLIKEVKSNPGFWDGTENGKYLNSSNYWFKVVTENGEILHGNFSLLRK